MPRHLLLYGPPACGKSTAILRALGPARRLAGGYRTLRLWKGDVRAGFRQIPANSPEGVDAPWAEADGGVFLTLGPGEGEKRLYPDVLLNETLPLLTAEAPFYVIDECGGRELMLRPFREALVRRLTGPAPVVGVWKGEPGAGSRKELLDPGFRREWEALRELLQNHPDILLLKAGTGQEMVRAVQSWMEENGVTG